MYYYQDINNRAIPDWIEKARCRNLGYSTEGLFFPGVGGSSARALEICSECPVTEQCLEYALENRFKVGVWGGKTETQRRKILRKRALHIRESKD